MSYSYEVRNRDESKDFRRIAFKKQETLVGALSANWKIKTEEIHKDILKRGPFDDNARPRALYFRVLREKGLLEKEIERLAYERFPRPK